MQPMAWDKVWNIVIRFAIAGFLIAEFATMSFTFKASNVITNLLTLASPGSWLVAHVLWSDAHRVLFLFVVFPIANGVVYATFGFVIAALTTKPKN
jgi:hypothetical protein